MAMHLPYEDELLNLIRNNPDFSNLRLSHEMEGRLTPKQIANWKHNNRAKISRAFGETKKVCATDCTPQDADEAARIVEKLTGQTDAEVDAYRAQIRREAIVDGVGGTMTTKDAITLLKDEVAKKDAVIDELKHAEQSLRAQLSDAKQKGDMLLSEVNGCRAKVENAGRAEAERDEARRLLADKNAIIAEMQRRVSELEDEVASACGEAAALKFKLEESRRRIEQLDKENDERCLEMLEMRKQLESTAAAPVTVIQSADADDELTRLKLLIADRAIAEWRRAQA